VATYLAASQVNEELLIEQRFNPLCISGERNLQRVLSLAETQMPAFRVDERNRTPEASIPGCRVARNDSAGAIPPVRQDVEFGAEEVKRQTRQYVGDATHNSPNFCDLASPADRAETDSKRPPAARVNVS
jgi:hypothetical protein